MSANRSNDPIRIEITPRTPNQTSYLEAIRSNYITFGAGPAGTGKTFIAILQAMKELEEGKVSQIVLTRPTQEAGEKLGFLPGGLEEKLDPFMMPLYDAMHEYYTPAKIEVMMSRGLIEIAPIAYMRGRTFRNCFVIVDESQNLTLDQLKMVLTRFGEGSRMVVNGDVSQSDLNTNKENSMSYAKRIADHGVDGLEYIQLTSEDVIRHRVVKDLVDVWEKL